MLEESVLIGCSNTYVLLGADSHGLGEGVKRLHSRGCRLRTSGSLSVRYNTYLRVLGYSLAFSPLAAARGYFTEIYKSNGNSPLPCHT